MMESRSSLLRTIIWANHLGPYKVKWSFPKGCKEGKTQVFKKKSWRDTWFLLDLRLTSHPPSASEPGPSLPCLTDQSPASPFTPPSTVFRRSGAVGFQSEHSAIGNQTAGLLTFKTASEVSFQNKCTFNMCTMVGLREERIYNTDLNGYKRV